MAGREPGPPDCGSPPRPYPPRLLPLSRLGQCPQRQWLPLEAGDGGAEPGVAAP